MEHRRLKQSSVKELIVALGAAFRGEVITDISKRALYSTDASMYQILPEVVCVPLDENDVKAAVRLAAHYEVPIVARGAGTSLGGQPLGSGLLIDMSAHLDRIVDVDVQAKTARVQPGVVRDQLNALVKTYGLHFAPDPATTSRCTIGGMVGNNSSGMRSIIYGKTVDHVVSMRVLLMDGAEMTLRERTPDQWREIEKLETREGQVHREFRALIEQYGDEIQARYPRIMRRCNGYNLDEFIPGTVWNLSKLITGSEGTLALVLEVTVRLEPIPVDRHLVALQYHERMDAIRATPSIVAHGPSAIELLDHTIIGPALDSPSVAPLCDFIVGRPGGVLLVEFFGDESTSARTRADAMENALNRSGEVGYAVAHFKDAPSTEKAWQVRRNGQSLMLGMKGRRKPVAFIEDAAVPLEHLAKYIGEVIGLCARHGVEVAMYAHASVGLLHVRPILDLRDPEDIRRMVAIAEETFQRVMAYGGSWSGEHGDGLVRGSFLPRFFGPRIMDAFSQVKGIFDPTGALNPGKIVDVPPMDLQLRYGEEYKTPDFMTAFQFRGDGSFADNVEMCTGVGSCRQTTSGTMCPSYRATRREEDNVRGRVNMLWLAMTGQYGLAGIGAEEVARVMALCLSCKACKSECPNGVDMAKLKSEALHARHAIQRPSLRSRLFAESPRASAFIAGPCAPVVNFIQERPLARKLLEKFAGIDPSRALPRYAARPLMREQAHMQRTSLPPGAPRVLLFADTYANFHEPSMAANALALLHNLGVEAQAIRPGCCQRPRISHGFLDRAKIDGEQTLRALDAYIMQGFDVAVLEPSCFSALTDDLVDLVRDTALADRIKHHVLPLEHLLEKWYEVGRLSATLRGITNEVYIHGHCHQKALRLMQPLLNLYRRAGVKAHLIQAGCCGMAGSFGYEKEHRAISERIAEDRLLPAIRALPEDATLVCSGFSCRHQIADLAGRQALHWVETLKVAP